MRKLKSDNFRKRLGAILAFVIYLNLFYFNSLGGIGIALIIMSLVALVVTVFSSKKNSSLITQGIVVIALISLTEIFAGSDIRQVLGIWSGLLFLTIFAYALLRNYLPNNLLEIGLSPVYMAISYLGSGLDSFLSLMSGEATKQIKRFSSDHKQSSWLQSVFTGFVLGLPFVILLLYLLTQADPIFSNYLSHLFSADFVNKTIVRVVISVIIFIFLFPLTFMKLNKKYHSPLGWLTQASWQKEMSIILAMVAAVLAVFLVVQWPYVFANVAMETELVQFGVETYSEYVTKGFVELLNVAILIFAVSWLSHLLQSKKRVGYLSYLQFGVVAELIVFMISIFRRVYLYSQFHGLSIARLYGSIALVWLIGMIITMLLRNWRQRGIARYELGWTIVVILFSLGINLEALVVKHPPTVNNQVDNVYLSRLSSDGYQGWLDALSWTDQVLTSQLDRVSVNQPLSAQDRKELYYSGLVLSNLLENYNDLMLAYGSSDQLHDYLNKLATSQSTHQSLISAQSDNSSTDYEQVLSTLDSDHWSDVSVLLNSNYYHNSSRSGRYQFSLERLDNFYMLDIHSPLTQLAHDRSRLARLLDWNAQDHQAFLKLNELDSLSIILKNINTYRQLYQHVANLPDDSRWVEVDLSFSTRWLD